MFKKICFLIEKSAKIYKNSCSPSQKSCKLKAFALAMFLFVHLRALYSHRILFNLVKIFHYSLKIFT